MLRLGSQARFESRDTASGLSLGLRLVAGSIGIPVVDSA